MAADTDESEQPTDPSTFEYRWPSESRSTDDNPVDTVIARRPESPRGQTALSELHIALPRWWPGRPNTEVVGGDLETGAVIVHLPYEGSPYLARLPLDGSLPGTTATTMAELQRGYMTYEWSDRSWRWILISRTSLTSPEIGAIRESMTGDAAAPSRRGQTSPPARGPVSDD